MEQYGPISGQQIVNNFYSCKPGDIRRVFLFWILWNRFWKDYFIREYDFGTYRYAKT